MIFRRLFESAPRRRTVTVGPAVPEPPPLAVAGVPVQVRRSPRARRAAIRVDGAHDRVELVVPERMPMGAALAFLERHRGWVEARLAAIPDRIPFIHGSEVPILGIPHRIRHVGERGAPPVRLATGEIQVFGQAPHVPRRVADFLRTTAQDELACRAEALAASIGRRVGRVTVRDTKSRWGSCAVNGNLAFSWRLILAPEPVLHYVVAHEVAHLVEMNHGPRFWRLVADLAPGSEPHRAWLKRNRNLLLRYG